MRRQWKHTELVAVISRYTGEGPGRLALELSRSEDSVSGLARRLGQRTPRKAYRRSSQRSKHTTTA